MSNEVEIVVTGRDTGAQATLQNTRRSMNEVGDTTDDLATKSGTAAGAFGALGSGLELVGVQGGVAAAALQTGALATDFFSGVTDFATLALQSSIVTKIRDTAATIASTVAQRAVAAATRAYAAVQWVLNAALAANPIGLVIIAIVALVAAIVLAYRNSETFRRICQAAFRAVAAAGQFLWKSLQLAFKGVQAVASATWNALKKGASGLSKVFSTYAKVITAPYRAAFAGIRAAWNATVGGRGFSVPGWIPGVGGKSFRIPMMATGGPTAGGLAVVGERGRELVNLPSGSSVSPNANTEATLRGAGGGGRPIELTLELGGRMIAKVLIDPLRREIRSLGGDVQATLGSA